jgi:uncharacterized membrane protein YqjE
MVLVMPAGRFMRRDQAQFTSLTDGLHKLADDGRAWVAAEAALAKAEVKADTRRLLWLALVIGLALLGLMTAFMLFALFVVAALAPYVGSLAASAGLLAAALAVVSGACVWAGVHMARQRFGIMHLLQRWGQVMMRGKEALHENA